MGTFVFLRQLLRAKFPGILFFFFIEQFQLETTWLEAERDDKQQGVERTDSVSVCLFTRFAIKKKGENVGYPWRWNFEIIVIVRKLIALF